MSVMTVQDTPALLRIPAHVGADRVAGVSVTRSSHFLLITGQDMLMTCAGRTQRNLIICLPSTASLRNMPLAVSCREALVALEEPRRQLIRIGDMWKLTVSLFVSLFVTRVDLRGPVQPPNRMHFHVPVVSYIANSFVLPT